jgi:hypothetical protein
MRLRLIRLGFILLITVLIASNQLSVPWWTVNIDGLDVSLADESGKRIRDGMKWLWRIHGGP